MSVIMNHTKCQKCQKTLNVVDLKDNPDGIGRICIDAIECKKQEQKNIEKSNSAPKPTR